jgi:hypothetical protein
MHVLTNTLSALDAQRLFADGVRQRLERDYYGLVLPSELIPSCEPPAGAHILQLRLVGLRLEGGVSPNTKLWLTLQWHAELRAGDGSQSLYSTGGTWQSHLKRTLLKCAADAGMPLRTAVEEGCRQLATVVAEQVAPAHEPRSPSK